VDFVVRCGRIEVEQRLDVAAHVTLLGLRVWVGVCCSVAPLSEQGAPMSPDFFDAVEQFFVGSRTAYNNWTLASGRELRVMSVYDCPTVGLTTHISFDGMLVEWPDVKAHLRLLPLVPV